MAQVNSATVIINAHSGFSDKEELPGRLAEIFDSSGLNAHIVLAQTGEEVQAAARKAARESGAVVVAAGGDGTVNAVASIVVDSDAVLGVLPLGTLNHFARDLGIPDDLETAAHALISGQTILVDVGEVNGRIFLNNSSLGLYPIIVREREKRQRLGSRKWPAFAWATIQAFRRYPFLDVRLQVDGRKLDRRTPFVFIGNNEYAMERFEIGLRDCLDGGQLSLYITHRTGRLGLLKLALRALLGRLREDKDFLALRTDEAKIETRHMRLRVALDGEVEVIETPLEYRVRPRALRVIVPAAESK
ncbi:MAG: diacylglycerol kinase family protein [Pyrinomonadaceae bacterium]